MDYISEKLTTITGNALGTINEMKRKRDQREHEQQDQRQDQYYEAVQSVAYDSQQTPNRTHALQSSPFGGESSLDVQQRAPPAIGFNLTPVKMVDGQAKETRQQQITDSIESVYDGDAWSRLWFPRIMILTLIRLLLFIRKVYEDFHATKSYKRAHGATGYFFVAAASLLLPTIVFTIYRVARYIQCALPSVRMATRNKTNPNTTIPSQVLSQGPSQAPSSSTPLPPSSAALEDEGLVTARQTPTNVDDFHDTRSQSNPSPIIRPDDVSRSLEQESKPSDQVKESFDVDKLGNLPDKDTTRIVLGISEQLLHGVLYIFWQIKRQVDVVSYLVDRSCLWRKPRDDERDQLNKLSISSDGLEWFQDFYAAFLAILVQVYTLGLYWTNQHEPMPIENSVGQSIADTLINGDKVFSAAGKAVNSAISSQQSLATGLDPNELLIVSQLVVSSAVVVSLLFAVRRRDDGPMTFGLSMIGWGSIFSSRIIVIALAFVNLGWKIMLPLIVCHVAGITAWIYKIAIDSHNGSPSECEESEWLPEQSTEDNQQSIELNKSDQSNEKSADTAVSSDRVVDNWTVIEHLALLTQIFTLFALPSLFYWPIMFNLKIHCRPFKYLVLIMSENFILIPAIWFKIGSAATVAQWYLLGATGAFTIVGFLFVFLYVSCKPSLTEYFARADQLFNEAERSGIYFEFCSRVFKMPDLSKHAFRRLMNQHEQIEETN